MSADISRRQHLIMDYIREHGSVQVDQLSNHLRVTPQTIRRDLNQLYEQQLLQRVHGGAVVKPLDLMAGRSVFVTGPEDPNRRVLLETMSGNGSRYVMAQRYLPEVVESGDARILLIDGEPIPHALVRFAPPGDHRANMSVGARTETRPLTEAEQRICELVGPVLHEMGLVLVGIDVIGSYLTEINVTSPTGIRELDGACDINVAAGLLDAVQSHVDSD